MKGVGYTIIDIEKDDAVGAGFCSDDDFWVQDLPEHLFAIPEYHDLSVEYYDGATQNFYPRPECPAVFENDKNHVLADGVDFCKIVNIPEGSKINCIGQLFIIEPTDNGEFTFYADEAFEYEIIIMPPHPYIEKRIMVEAI